MKKKVLLLVVGLLICFIPIIAVIVVSNKEMDKFKVDKNYDLREKAYGEIVSPTRSDIEEYYTLDGEITSDTIRFIKIPECNYENIRWLVDIDQEIRTGERIGFCGDIDIFASCDGIIKEIDVMAEEPYIKVQSFEGLLFKAIVPLDLERKMKDIMYDKDKNKFKLVRKSRQYTDEGVAVSYKIEKSDNYRYGQKLEGFDLYTGEVYSEVLVLPKSCVYKEYDGKHYVRLCDDAGFFVREQEVNIGYEIKEYISITGISEKDMCDSGYSYAKNDEDIPDEIELLEPTDDYYE